MRKLNIRVKIIISLFTLLINFYCWFVFNNNNNAIYYPTSTRLDISALLEKGAFTRADYSQLFSQTGLGRPAVDALLKERDGKARILAFQREYFTRNKLFTEKLNVFTSQETLVADTKYSSDCFGLAPLKDGDILLTKSTQTFFWRHGHCGIVINAEKGISLESLEPGTVSMKQDISKWRQYSTLKVLRLKNPDQKILDNIVKYSERSLSGIKYNILAPKCRGKIVPEYENCSLMIWQAFISSGYDLDSNKGVFVTPEDIAKSPLLEIVQIKGFNPQKAW